MREQWDEFRAWVKAKYYANKPKTLIVGIISIIFIGMLVTGIFRALGRLFT